ncbi:uncharacterized protein BX663DRAFT_500573 [Cokeromyces recurvatus]|uniref:uncharacterized protein n=1 Tax=Cokeromyces recurvatus TaxID=90255 RepID=UPI00221F7A4C|nr:uncharacterized protein BX663DRAFT_500573 [Cokeromyces recurvatus]KAI7905684.1 hypothetical protein BX663DRAFT_500573 [Cokeromyces recurvatus]
MRETDELLDIDYVHAQYSVMNVTNMNSMASDELEEVNKNLSNLLKDILWILVTP